MGSFDERNAKPQAAAQHSAESASVTFSVYTDIDKLNVFVDTITRFDYGEDRWVTTGMVYDIVVVVVWTETPDGRHVISMRKAEGYEQGEYYEQLG